MRRKFVATYSEILKIRCTKAIVHRQRASQNHTYRCSIGSCRQTLQGAAQKHMYNLHIVRIGAVQAIVDRQGQHKITRTGAAQAHKITRTGAAQALVDGQGQHKITLTGAAQALVDRQGQHKITLTGAAQALVDRHFQGQHKSTCTGAAQALVDGHFQGQHKSTRTGAAQPLVDRHFQGQHKSTCTICTLYIQVQYRLL